MIRPFYISKETWKWLTWKEQDFIVFLREKRYTKDQIKRRLYITTEMWYWKLQKRVLNKIKSDINRVYNL